MNTRAHQLAQFVVYESPLQVACDSPYNYRISPAGTEFLQVVPTVWDDTHVIDGFPGEFIVIARQHEQEWFLGGLNNETQKSIDIPLNFLGNGTFKVKIFADAYEAADYPDRLNIYEKTIDAQDTLKIDMAGSGGVAIQFLKFD